MFELIRRNRTRSVWLVCVMAGLLVGVGFVGAELLEPGAGPAGITLAVVVTITLFLFSYYAGGSVLLMASGARQIDKKHAPQLYNIVEEMVIASGLRAMPKVYVIESNVANAFATGRKPEVAAIAVTEGLLNLLNREELQAVVAHEIAHVKNRDILFMTLLAVMAGAIALLADFLRRYFFWFGAGRRQSRSSNDGGGQAQVVILLVGIVLMIVGALTARLIYFAASRTREYLADVSGAVFTRNPGALASALAKISGNVAGNKLPVPAVAQAMLIVGARLFSTHPPIARRIAVLEKLAGTSELSYRAYADIFRSVSGRRASFMPRSALQTPAVAALSPSTPPTAHAHRAEGAAYRREALDALKARAGYRRVPCPCGATLKVPPDFPARARLSCLSCGRVLES